MKIPIIDFTLNNLHQLRQQNDWSDHFNLILWPRILIWLGIKEQFKEYTSLNWMIHYTPDNMHNNFISAHIKDDHNTFNFYFQIPLVEKLSFNLYLGDSTYNFFEIYPILLSKGIIKKDEYKLRATSTILPHLVLSTANSKYEKSTLYKINEKNYLTITQTDPLINLLTVNYKKFIPPLKKIIQGEWLLK